jgi:hypothetical protein
MKGNIIWGSIVIMIGAIVLLENMGIISGSIWGYIWPIFIIIVGVSIILNDRKA